MLELELPYPPSANHLWRRVGSRTLISHEVRPFHGPLQVSVVVHPPDDRRRDVDNLPKALLDALDGGGAYDDSQNLRLSIEKRDVIPNGKTLVRIEAYR